MHKKLLPSACHIVFILNFYIVNEHLKSNRATLKLVLMFKPEGDYHDILDLKSTPIVKKR